MPVIIATKNGEKSFQDKNVITVGSQANCDVVVNVPVNFVLSVEVTDSGLKVVNAFSTPQIRFRGQSMGESLTVERACKLMIAGTDEFVGIKLQQTQAPVPTGQSVAVVSQQRPMPQQQQQPHPQPQRQPHHPRRPAQPHHPQVTMTAIA